MIKFITYLSGNTGWTPYAPSLPKAYVPVPTWISDVLGLSSEAMCACLYRLYKSHPCYYLDLEGSDGSSIREALSSLRDGVLNLTGQGAASVKPSVPPFVADKMIVGTPVLERAGVDQARISVGDYQEVVKCRTSNTTLEVEWPSWLHITGALHSQESRYELPVVWSYPVDRVDAILRKSSEAYDFMEKYNTVSLFFSEDHAEGRVCAFLRAVLRHVNYLA